MKDKTNKWLPWISSLLIGIIISSALIAISESYTMSTYPGVFLPSPIPSTQVNAISTIDSINEFSGDESRSYFSKGARAGIAISLVLMFVIIPFLYMKGTLQSEKKENPSALWYIGSALMLVIVILPVIGGTLKMYTYQSTKESSTNNKKRDLMRMELTDVSFVIAEQILELNEISSMSEINAENIPQIKNSEYPYMLVSNPADTSVTITILSDQIDDFSATTVVRPYSDEIFKFQRTF